ncbi:MAG: GNAT family N-acetyltransferase [Candidatus Acidoferrales bacterium]
MAVAPQLAPVEIVDLRRLRARDLAPLLEEQQRTWLTELFWDYRPSAAMIAKHLDARTLLGSAALVAGRVAGYCFYVVEEHKGLLGDLYVLERYRRQRAAPAPHGIATRLLEQVLDTLEQFPRLRRLEAQLIPWGTEPLAPVFLARDFRSFPRLFMYKSLRPQDSRPPPEQPPDLALRPWDDRYFEPTADLVLAAYRDHVDSHINDQYAHRSGALRFLKNIVIFPGCGLFLPECSLVALPPGQEEPLLGVVLTSQVAPGIAHVTQVSIAREWQGRGLGRCLMDASLARLVARRFRGVSLTVTAENVPAVRLYNRLGFHILKGFAAFARTLT